MIEWLILGAAGIGTGAYLIKRHNAKVAAEAAKEEQEFRDMLKRAEEAAPVPTASSYAPRKSTYVPPAPAKKTTSRTSDSGISEAISFAAGAAVSSWLDSSSSSSSSSSDSSSYSSGGGDSGGGGSSSDF